MTVSTFKILSLAGLIALTGALPDTPASKTEKIDSACLQQRDDTGIG